MVNRWVLVPGANLIILVHWWGCEQLADSAHTGAGLAALPLPATHLVLCEI